MSALTSLRLVSLLEGLSLLVLLLVAMPLKHVYGLPAAVRVVGSIHGLLFLSFVGALYRAHVELAWTPGRTLRLVWLSLWPLGFVAIDRTLKRELARDHAGTA